MAREEGVAFYCACTVRRVNDRSYYMGRYIFLSGPDGEELYDGNFQPEQLAVPAPAELN